jgi:hypothetical protein
MIYYNFSKCSHLHEIISHIDFLSKKENFKLITWPNPRRHGPATRGPREHKAAHADSPHARSGDFAKTSPRLSQTRPRS